MTRQAFNIEQVLALSAETPRRIALITGCMQAHQLRVSIEDGGWSATDVLAHLRSCADVWGQGIASMIAEDRPSIRAVNPRTWVKSTGYAEQDFQSSLDAFARQRAELLATLQSLAAEDWSRSATVTGAGKVQERTLLFYADRLARHEQLHLGQIDRIVKSVRALPHER